MRWNGLLMAAIVIPLAAAPAAAQDKPAPVEEQTCTALVLPSVVGASGNAADMANIVRDLFATYLTGPTLKSVSLEARLPSQAVEEARQKQCDHVLVVKLTEKHHGGSSLGKAVGQAAGTAAWYIPGGGVAGEVARGTTAGVASAVSTLASGTRANDEMQMEYTLSTVGGRTLLTRSDKAKSSADGEDLVTPLVERAAMAIAAAPAK